MDTSGGGLFLKPGKVPVLIDPDKLPVVIEKEWIDPDRVPYPHPLTLQPGEWDVYRHTPYEHETTAETRVYTFGIDGLI